MTPIDLILSRLAERTGAPHEDHAGHWMAHCPAHEDAKRASLSISVGDDGRVLLKCFAGCPFAAIMAGLGLEEKDAFPPRAPSSPSTPPAKSFNAPAFLARARANLDALARAPVAPSVDWLPIVQSLHGGISWEDKVRGYRQAIVLPVCDPAGAEVGAKLRFLGPHVEGKLKSQSLGKSGILGHHLLTARPEARIVVASGEKDQIHGLWICPEHAWLSPSSGEAQSLAPFRDILSDSDRPPPVWIPDVDQKGREGVQKVISELGIAARAAWLPLDGSPTSKDLADYLDPIPTTDEARAALTTMVDGAGPYAPPAPPDDAPLNGDLSDDALALAMTDSPVWPPARHVAAWGRWMLWDVSRWAQDDALRHMTLTRAYLRQRADAIISADHESDRAAAKAEVAAKGIRSARTVAAVSGLARSNPAVAASVDEWDLDPWLLGTPAGTVDLRTGNLRPARPEDKITKLAGCSPAPPGSRSPLWDAFLARITDGSMPLEDYLRRFAGYALTGLVREHVFAFGYGEGQNGKSVFLDTLQKILGDYSAVIPTEMLMVSMTDRHPTEVARLRGVRLAVGSETEDGRSWAESKIKALTGGDRIAGRFMRQDLFEFDPQFKLFVIGNKMPSLHGVDKAIRRRLHLVPFTVTIPEPERDKQLKEKLVAEWPAILRWAIDGCLEWQKIELAPPEIVTVATDAYLDEEDAIGQWMADVGQVVNGKKYELAADLWASWKGWSKAAGEEPGTQTAFGRKLTAKGLGRGNVNGAKVRYGFLLNEPVGGEGNWSNYQTDPEYRQ